jgi:predicted nucleic acid-binding protein
MNSPGRSGVSSVWVVNASPIITLAKIGRLDLLSSLASKVVVPHAVIGEVTAGPMDDPGRLAIESSDIAARFVKASPDSMPSSIVEWGLGNGESAVLALALEIGATAVLDDAAARAAARAFKIPLLGTIGVVLRAKVRGIIPSAAPLIQELRSAGLHLDDRLIGPALANIGESWPISADGR